MRAIALSLLLLCTLASTATLAQTNQPELAAMAQSYVQQLQAEGIISVISPGSGATVRVETDNGAIYVKYPPGLAPLSFTLDVDSSGVQATAATFDRTRDGQAFAALLPEVIRTTRANNRLAWLRANPSH